MTLPLQAIMELDFSALTIRKTRFIQKATIFRPLTKDSLQQTFLRKEK
jgi:hypothetical protein